MRLKAWAIWVTSGLALLMGLSYFGMKPHQRDNATSRHNHSKTMKNENNAIEVTLGQSGAD